MSCALEDRIGGAPTAGTVGVHGASGFRASIAACVRPNLDIVAIDDGDNAAATHATRTVTEH